LPIGAPYFVETFGAEAVGVDGHQVQALCRKPLTHRELVGTEKVHRLGQEPQDEIVRFADGYGRFFFGLAHYYPAQKIFLARGFALVKEKEKRIK
jgi:hypothetical protein